MSNPNPHVDFTHDELIRLTRVPLRELDEYAAQPKPLFPIPLKAQVEMSVTAAELLMKQPAPLRRDAEPEPPPSPEVTNGTMIAYQSRRLPLPAGPNEIGVWGWYNSPNGYQGMVAHAADVRHRHHGDPWDRNLIAQYVRENRRVNVVIEWQIPVELYHYTERELLNRTIPALCSVLRIPEYLMQWECYRTLVRATDGQDLARNGMSVEVWMPDEEFGV